MQIWKDLLKKNKLPSKILLQSTDLVMAKNTVVDFISWYFDKRSDYLDSMVIEPDLKGKISIDNIRKLISFSEQQANLVDNKIIFIHNAAAMNSYSANALLKTLEEATNTIFILTTTNDKLLLPTILSRCTKFNLDIDVNITITTEFTAKFDLFVAEPQRYFFEFGNYLKELSISEVIPMLWQKFAVAGNWNLVLEINQVLKDLQQQANLNTDLLLDFLLSKILLCCSKELANA